MVESAAGAPPSMLTYAPSMVQPQAAYYQVGGMQAVAVQPQVAYGTTAPGMQNMMVEQQTVAQPCMAMAMPQTQVGATMEQSVAVPQQTEVAAPVMEQPAMVTSKKAKMKFTSKKKEKGCC